jgi:hypothetical membrane protein
MRKISEKMSKKKATGEISSCGRPVLTHYRFLTAAYVYLLLTMSLLPLLRQDDYSLIRHTTSQLGAQQAPYAWIMNLGFILIGLASLIAAWQAFRRHPFQKVILSLFSLSLILTGFFSHAPIDPSLPYSLAIDQVHSILATVTGFAFTVFAFSMMFIEQTTVRRLLALAIACMATGLSMLMWLVGSFAGIWQRLIFILAFAWLIFSLQAFPGNLENLDKSVTDRA